MRYKQHSPCARIHVLPALLAPTIITMSLLELGPIIFGPKRDLIDYLQNKHLIARNMHCQQCGIHSNELGEERRNRMQ